LNHVALAIGIAYPPALLFAGAITLVLLITVHFSWELSRLEERTRRLAEELALARSEGSTRGWGDTTTTPLVEDGLLGERSDSPIGSR
jgi:hypothetical protein